MGSKSAAKSIMADAGRVRWCPAITAPTRIRSCFAREAGKIGYPVLIKATAGGGGKGMNIVERAAELRRGAGLRAA